MSAAKHTLLAFALLCAYPALADEPLLRQAQQPPSSERSPWMYSIGLSASRWAQYQAAAAHQPQRPPQDQMTLLERRSTALFESGVADIEGTMADSLRTYTNSMPDASKVFIEVVGHADAQPLSPRAAVQFGDNLGLSMARAVNVARYLQSRLQLNPSQITVRAMAERAPASGLAKDPAGWARNRRVEIRAWYPRDESPAIAPPAPAPAHPCTTEPVLAEPLDAWQVTVDGQPASGASVATEADHQRCVDVAAALRGLQMRIDPLNEQSAANVWVAAGADDQGRITLGTWANHGQFASDAAVLIYADSTDAPVATLKVRPGHAVQWGVPRDGRLYQMVLELRDGAGRTDRTARKPIEATANALAGWGVDSLVERNIQLTGAMLTVSGVVPSGTKHVPSVMGDPVPVDSAGRFVTRRAVPAGPLQMSVELPDPDGGTVRVLRNATVADQDWFYVAIGDLTLGHGHARGPGRSVLNEGVGAYEKRTYIDGRGAFFLKGTVSGEWLLKASADTGERPLEDLFTGFDRKDPRYVLRRIDPAAHYPVYGDDSTISDEAPTQGRFYVRLERGDDHVMWGNFRTSWTGTELAQFSRALYGAQAVWTSEAVNASRGEALARAEVFMAEPGTLGAREQHRGTGGRLYHLRQLDISVGSERLWVETRDQLSGTVRNRRLLQPGTDYEINALQGRVILSEPLASSIESANVVRSGGVVGDPQYLVATYEYTPGLNAADGFAGGGRTTWWASDALRIGLSAYRQGAGQAEQGFGGIDALARIGSDSWVAVELARASGSGEEFGSIDGGFVFDRPVGGPSGAADAHRVEAMLRLADLGIGLDGQILLSHERAQDGFAAPGFAHGAQADRISRGVHVSVQADDTTRLDVRHDARDDELAARRQSEASVTRTLSDSVYATAAIRHDQLDRSAPALSTHAEGDRTDVQLRADWAPDPERWRAHAFVQDTVARDAGRVDNQRAGIGGQWQASEALRLSTEASGGDGGPGLRMGANMRVNETSEIYLNAQLESEQPETGREGRYGTVTGGARTRLGEQLTAHTESRWSGFAGDQSLLNGFGLDYTPAEAWRLGGLVEAGEVEQGGVRFNRRAFSVSGSWKEDPWRASTVLEWREDSGGIERSSWLSRSTAMVKIDQHWRAQTRLELARSAGDGGLAWRGDYTEWLLAAAWREHDDDGLNALFSYRYLEDLPTPGQAVANTETQWRQRSHILSTDLIAQLNHQWSVGGKLGWRTGSIQAREGSSPWFDAGAALVSLRADWHVVHRWDALVEWRGLRAWPNGGTRQGVVLGMYRHLGAHTKLGVGYSFADFSDDLGRLDYRYKGWFINGIAKW